MYGIMEKDLEGPVVRYYVISDVHGFYTPMTDTLKRAGYFDDPQPHKLIILGDLFDRGTEAPALQEFVIDLIERDAVILIRGNHEDLYEELATVDQGQPFSHHISNGTYDTALQLTGMDKWMALIHQYDFAEAAQDTPYYKRIIPAMQNYYETAHYIFVHGWIPCLRERTTYCSIGNWRKADDNMWSTARWFNGMDANQFVYEDGKTIVCGHWHASYGHTVYEKKGSEFGPNANFQPYYGNGIIALDACTVVSGFVNCIIIDD